ncbi:MAG TPA: PKD domain-containing protein, partial [Flavisolibacter sp.]|nr:PKD domain-containing protein [Flavisolibacter sp.]
NRKELHITIGDCDEIDAVPAVFDVNGIRVEANGASCKSFTFTFDNAVPANPLINSYYWEISDGATYNVKNPSHTFTTDTGLYTIKLVVNRGQECSDSATTTLRVYPGFFTGFTQTGVCVNKTTSFTDTSSTRYGTITSWQWDFGEPTVTNDQSTAQNPTFTYPTQGTKNVRFIVTNSVGCVDTVRKPIDIMTRPPLTVAFKDTLVCRGDSVQLEAIGQGIFSWTPATNILNGNTATPIVHPPATTNYIVQLDDQGCLANDTVRVNVIDFVSVQARADTVICEGDSLQLSATTNGLTYEWSNTATVSDPDALNTTARPIDNPTIYTITARIGPRCFATDNVVVSLVPYATVNAGFDTTICFNTTAQLNGATDGSLIGWLPRVGLSDPVSLNPVVNLRQTASYILSAANSLGCVSRDTVVITVNREVVAFAGRDTSVVAGQTLQFNASGGQTYSWSPATALSATNIADPRGTYNGSFDSIRYHLEVADSLGCTDDATMLVKIFRTNPRVFVPTAFTPNGDGRNEIVAPIAVGLSKLDYFRIYNRWGQLVFQTTVNGKGWDGKIGGKEQSTSTYVWIVKGTDYTGKTVFEKGTVTLIR